MRQDLKTQIVTKLKNSKYDKTKKSKSDCSKTQIVKKKLKKTEIVTLIKNWNFDKTKPVRTQKRKLW